MKFSAKQAATQVGRSTATITRAIEKHKISATKNESGAWEIEASELFRVFAPAKPENPSMQRLENPNEKGVLQGDVEVMAEKLRSADALNDRLADEVADLRRRLDDEATERRKLTALLTAPPSAKIAPLGGLWSRLMGRAGGNA